MENLIFEILKMAGFIVVLFLCCLWLVKDKRSFYKFWDWGLIPLTALAGFVIYCIGYWEAGTKESLITLVVRSFLSTFHMFFLHSDLLEVRHHMHTNATYMFAFSIIHFAAFLVSFLVVLQLFGKQFLSWLKLKLSTPKDSYIFFDLNEGAVALAEDLLKKDRKRFILFIDKNVKHKLVAFPKINLSLPRLRDKESLFEKISKTEAVFLKKDFSEEVAFDELKISKLVDKSVCRMFFLSENEDYNIHMSLKVIGEIRRLQLLPKELRLYVNADSEELIDLFAEKIGPLNVEVHIFNRSKLAAQELITNYPPVNALKLETSKAVALSDFSMLIIGFGNMGSEALKAMIEQGQFVGSTFRATIIDKEMKCKAGLFEHYYPGLKNYQLEYHEAEVNSSEFFNLLKDKLAGLKYILVALGEDELNIKTAVELSHFISRETDNDQIKILTDVYNTRDYSYIQQAKECFKEICLYGSNDNIYTEDIIINESREMTARKIHAYYNAQKAVEKQVPWQALSPIKKMTNISAASHIYTKLQLAGLTPQDFAQWSTEEEYVKALGNERFENLAKGEHLHWNATLFVHEWDVWHLSDIPDFVSVNKDEKHKKHACLVDWEELKKVEERFGEPYRKYDRDSVRNIWELAKANLL